ncbi:DsrE family protein [Xanthobacter agilis]|uniref:Intracellular sulfur oxidation DsrE/DsrF family protein n=1 Tax=Xanthobacter agilis TaxID=47492 RepID=A0ABU0LEK3_XANAG|nr:DsrE family protein [Xanthobacter agilis]MDQ0505563.1 intracellular sulfur oxidation DsrE/DsrF family protein [Xanthobacter agilis]
MPHFDRRAFLGTMALAGALPVAAEAAQNLLQTKDIAKEADTACLYHCDYGDPNRFAQTLNNISNHYAAYGADPFAIQIALVAHAGGVKFFLDSLDGTLWEKETLDPQLAEKTDALSKNGLKVYLCSFTFERNKIPHEKARTAPYIAFVPSGVATVGALQNKGFAYLKVG